MDSFIHTSDYVTAFAKFGPRPTPAGADDKLTYTYRWEDFLTELDMTEVDTEFPATWGTAEHDDGYPVATIEGPFRIVALAIGRAAKREALMTFCFRTTE